jgi:glycosyltransferase involved in cell wall biosynthesis
MHWGSHFVVSWYEIWGQQWYSYLGPAGALGLAVERAFCRLPEKLIAVSGITRQDLITSGVHPERVDVIPNGIDYGRIRAVSPAPTHYDIGYCGRLKNHKNIDVLLRAVALVKRTKPDVSVVIIGDGPERQSLERLASELGLERNVQFTGALDDFDDVAALLKSCSIFIHPSTKEGGGSITLLEANACGLPVIAVRCKNGIDPSLISQGENGYFVDSLSPELIADQAAKLLFTSGQLCKNREAAIRMAAGYDWEIIAEQHERLYAGLLENGTNS